MKTYTPIEKDYCATQKVYWSVSKEFFAKKKISAKKILRKEKDAKKAKENIP